jgi:hypothetical protein
MNFLEEIFEELSSSVPATDPTRTIESRVNHLLVGLINMKRSIRESFSPEEADDLIKRIDNSVRGEDPSKFGRGIRRLRESRKVQKGKTNA